ncbi:MAG TPA: response regulator [Candidatus Dormibacteraeota bacterium]|jgi:DNA-binding response OmpR family regulator|nr:response regulator [Candidatus Dormibacteraeota bacterium]
MARVLIVEDEPSIARIIQFKLEREGHRTRWVEGGEAARDRAGEADVVVLDSALPEVDLATLVAELSRRSRLLLLVDSRSARMAEGGLQGADEVLRKPFRPTQLARLVRRLGEAR